MQFKSGKLSEFRFSFTDQCVKMKSIRKLSNFNFQWPNHLYQNNYVNRIAFFFLQFFKGYRCNQLLVTTPKTFLMGAKKMNLSFHTNCENTGKISCVHVRLHFVKYEIYFLWLPSEIFFQFYWCYYNNNQLLL